MQVDFLWCPNMRSSLPYSSSTDTLPRDQHTAVTLTLSRQHSTAACCCSYAMLCSADEADTCQSHSVTLTTVLVVRCGAETWDSRQQLAIKKDSDVVVCACNTMYAKRAMPSHTHSHTPGVPHCSSQCSSCPMDIPWLSSSWHLLVSQTTNMRSNKMQAA